MVNKRGRGRAAERRPGPAGAPGQLLTLGDLGRRLTCHRTTIWRRVRNAELPAPIYLVPGGRPKWREVDIVTWIEARS